MRKRLFAAALLLMALAAAWLSAVAGPEPPFSHPAGTLAFAAVGDAPYYAWEELQYRLVRQALDANDLAFVIHVGDIFWRPCTDAHYLEVLGWFNALRHPVIYTPGDNETYDCWAPGAGGFAPQDRFAAIRRIFFADPTQSLGQQKIPLASQGGEFVENARWAEGGVVFATVDLIGSGNGTEDYPEHTSEDDTASRRRTEAAAAWARATFAEAARTEAAAVVLAFHANPYFKKPVYRQPYELFIAAVEDEAARFGRPVLIVHGDGHEYQVDRPLRATNILRMQVPGSPRVGWVKVVVAPGAATPFTFEEHVVPRWKYW